MNCCIPIRGATGLCSTVSDGIFAAQARQSLKSFLEREGIQVAGEASDGQELVGVAASVCPDVAVVDISMPLMNGLEAAGEIRRSSPQTRTILLTRHDEDQYVTEALRAGVKGYVLQNSAARSSNLSRATSPSVD